MEKKRIKATELTDEQIKNVVGGLNLESATLNYGICPECNAPLEEPMHCSKCGWKITGYLYSCPVCGQFDENPDKCSKCGWKREFTGTIK